MRFILQGAGCLVIFVGAVVGILGIIVVLDPLVDGGTKVVWGVTATIALVVGWLVWDRALRSAAAANAQRSEKPGTRSGTRVRSYRGYVYDIAVEWFQNDAKLLIAKGYRVADTRWEPLQEGHPLRYSVLSVLGLLTRTNWGQDGGTLRVTYELGSSRDQAATALASFARLLHDGPRGDPFADEPFEMTLPPLWEPAAPPPEAAAELLADAVFFARDPESTDPDYFSTVLVMMRPPTDDPSAFLTDQEADLQSRSAEEKVSFSRISLPAGEALSVQDVRQSTATIQYFIPTAFATFAIWFTTPLAEMTAREAQFDAIARSFRLKD
jgi:hypothetical protein